MCIQIQTFQRSYFSHYFFNLFSSADSRQERVKVEMGKTEFMFKVHTSNKEKALLNIVNINWNWRTLTYSLQKLHRQSLLSDKFLDLNTRIHQPPYQCPFHASDIERYSR